MTIQLPALPYPPDALEPHMSMRTLEFHYGKHHKGYVDNTNAAVANTDLEHADLVTIVKTAQLRGEQKLLNNSAQVWNHNFFWNSLTPRGGGAPTGALAALLARDLGGVEEFKAAFKAEALGHFGSGWVWLLLRGEKLVVTSYHDADSPLLHEGVKPLLTCDVWEHAYYLDHQSARARYVDTFLDHLANWNFAAAYLANAGR